MYECYYLLVWCEESDCWWQADQCEARSQRHAEAMLRGTNPRVWKHDQWCVVHHSELIEALSRRPGMQSLRREYELVAA